MHVNVLTFHFVLAHIDKGCWRIRHNVTRVVVDHCQEAGSRVYRSIRLVGVSNLGTSFRLGHHNASVDVSLAMLMHHGLMEKAILPHRSVLEAVRAYAHANRDGFLLSLQDFQVAVQRRDILPVGIFHHARYGARFECRHSNVTHVYLRACRLTDLCLERKDPRKSTCKCRYSSVNSIPRGWLSEIAIRTALFPYLSRLETFCFA